MKKPFIYYMLALGAVFTSCDSKKAAQSTTEAENTNQSESVVNDSTKLFIDASKVDSMVIIWDNDLKSVIEKADFAVLADAVSTAVYDTRLNSGDMMIKMQTPDYTVIIYNTGKSSDESDWLMVWAENGRIKFKNKWFNLPADKNLSADKNHIVRKLLDNYKENSN